MLHYFCFKNPNKNVSWLTFIHGAGGNSSIWSQQIRFFKNFYHLLLIDLRGHGKSISHKFDEIYTFENVTEDIIQVLDKEAINEIMKEAEPPRPDPPLAKPKVFNSINLDIFKSAKTSLTIG